MIKYTNPNPNLHINYLISQLKIFNLICSRKYQTFITELQNTNQINQELLADIRNLNEELERLTYIIFNKSNQQTK